MRAFATNLRKHHKRLHLLSVLTNMDHFTSRTSLQRSSSKQPHSRTLKLDEQLYKVVFDLRCVINLCFFFYFLFRSKLFANIRCWASQERLWSVRCKPRTRFQWSGQESFEPTRRLVFHLWLLLIPKNNKLAASVAWVTFLFIFC